MPLLEMRPYILNHPENLIGHHSQKDKHSCSLDDVSFIESYVEAKAHILLRLRDRNFQQYIACIQRDWKTLPPAKSPLACTGGISTVNPLKPLRELLLLAWRHGARGIYERNGHQDTMLVDIIQPVELPERVAEPSLIWLDTVDGFYSRLPHALYLSTHSLPVFVGGIEDWKRRLTIGFIPGSDDEFIGQIVKRSAQIVESVAQHQSEGIGDLRHVRDFMPDLAQVFVGLSDDNIGVCFPEPVSSRIEVLDVLFGPVQFR